MFEHLGHIHRKNFEFKKDKPIVLPSLLVISLLIFAMSFFMQAGVSSRADTSPTADLAVDQSAKQIVAVSGQTSIFDFAINTPDKNIALDYLKIYINGLYDVEILNNLKLYHQGTQLNTTKNIDSAGNIYFKANDYRLVSGQNQFSLMLGIDGSIKAGDFLQVSLPDDMSVVLAGGGHIFTPNADYPLVGGSIAFVDKGQIAVYNNQIVSQLVLQNEINKIADLRLAASAETIDVGQIILTQAGFGDSGVSVFYLVQGHTVLSYGQIQDDKIVFDFLPQVLAVNKNIELQIIGQDLPIGKLSFYLEHVSGTGFASGQTIASSDRLLLSHLDIKNSILQFENSDINPNLSEGRNALSDILVTSLGSDSLALQKMTWKIDYQNIEITNFKVSIDDRLYQTGINWQDDQVAIYWDEPVEISGMGTRIKLLVEITDLKPGAQVQSYLLSDTKPLDQDNILDSNIIWTDSQDIFSGYLLPGFPMEPDILNK